MYKYINVKDSINYPEDYVLKNNLNYLNQEMLKHKKLLDDINGYPLDHEQRTAVLVNEEVLLINAGAGSGKTLTIIGKIRYLMEVEKLKETEILCISFTNEAVKSLKEKLLKNYNYNMEVKTFHKLAIDIINEDLLIADEKLLDEIIINNNEQKNKKLIKTFINLYKGNYSNNNYFKELFKNNYSYKNHKLLKKIYKIYYLYQEELKDNNIVDFNDLINFSINKVKDTEINYKYIIIDEYQDTSYTRFKLIENIVKKGESKLIVVGDDFQSIYRFTGCDLNLFLNINKSFPHSKTLSITNTYRNPQQLIETAGNFIMKNKYQIKKQLKSNINIIKPIKIIFTSNEKKTITDLLTKHNEEELFIIGRNNYDFKKYDIKLTNNHRYLTAHKSKGLEAKITILINLSNRTDGFPNKIKNHKLINKLVVKPKYLHDEERRLFYVALTRTKTITYLIVNKNDISPFVKEIIKKYKKNIETFYF